MTVTTATTGTTGTPAPAEGEKFDERYSLEDVVYALGAVDWFKKFLLDRFGAYTRTGGVTDTRGRPVEPVTDPHRPTSGGYGKWHIGRDWEAFARGERDSVTFRHYLEADRGSGTFTASVVVPGQFIHHTAEDLAGYAEYLRLKEIWEPAARP